MTPIEIETAARNKYNSIGDTFFSSSEIMQLIYEACVDLATEAMTIERLYTTSTVVGQQDYTYPSEAIALKRITYNGTKLKPVTMREDDALTILNQSTTEQGTPAYYFIWDEVIYLRPIPSTIGTLRIYSFNEPQAVNSTSVLEVPTMFHKDIVNYVVSEMCEKDENDTFAQRYFMKWEKGVEKAKRWTARKKRGDSFSTVQDEESLAETILGAV